MGNDGGYIPGRKDLVKGPKGDKSKTEESLKKENSATLCALTKEPLTYPVAICRLGNIYNEDKLIKAMIEKRLPDTFKHIKSLRDICRVNKKCTIVVGKNTDSIKLLCPVNLQEFSGLQKFFFIWTCGCVISNRALEELKANNKIDKCLNQDNDQDKGNDSSKRKIQIECINCNNLYTQSDIVDLTMDEEQKRSLWLKIIEDMQAKSSKRTLLGHKRSKQKSNNKKKESI